MAVCPRMTICPGIILSEAVFNQQPITDIVFHIVEQQRVHYRPHVANTVGSSLLCLQNSDDGRDTRPNFAARCIHATASRHVRTADRSSLRARIARSGE